jgi:cell division protein FtsZ
LLDITIDGARGILFNVTGGPDLTLFDVNQAAAIIKETAHPDVNLIFGAVIDPEMQDRVRVTVIATGFERTGVPRRIAEKAPISTPASTPVEEDQTPASPPKEEAAQPVRQVIKDFQPRSYNTEDLDIPAFLRNRSGR